jgi:hypothetical protein
MSYFVKSINLKVESEKLSLPFSYITISVKFGNRHSNWLKSFFSKDKKNNSLSLTCVVIDDLGQPIYSISSAKPFFSGIQFVEHNLSLDEPSSQIRINFNKLPVFNHIQFYISHYGIIDDGSNFIDLEVINESGAIITYGTMLLETTIQVYNNQQLFLGISKNYDCTLHPKP